MKTALIAYAGCLLTLAVVDALWLGIVARTFYRDQLGELMLPVPNLGIAALFYLLFTAAIVVLAVLPGLSGGSIGTTALDSSDLGQDGNVRFSFGPLISWSFPNIAVARARIAAAGANTDAALATFDQTVLTALQETETALSAYANELDRQAALRQARDQAANAARLSRLRFDAGVDSFLSVLDAERTLAGAEAAFAASQGQVATYQIGLFKALAGSWTPEAQP